MQKKRMPFNRYSPYPTVGLKDRTWPDRQISKAPIWCSTDLRDGNQALSIPMNIDQKMMMFDFLVKTGFKEIEVGFPSASEIEFRFVRRLIEEQKIPQDVTIQVITQAREHLIRRTFDSIQGAGRVIVHVYNSTSTVQREVVFKKTKEEIIKIAVDATRLIKSLMDQRENPDIRLQYSPESFPGTELDYAMEICSAVMSAWQPTQTKKMIINLPSTVEMSTPNVFADRIEWFCRNVPHRDCVTISVHTHNDRGTGVATAELAVMAGAERVEGALFGNGERSGNMDIVTMALNLFSQGVDPQLDFSDINQIVDVYQKCTGMEIHPRHPYAGSLVYTAFSGSHQDAINKGMKAQASRETDAWEVPYLPIDPNDVGRSYEAIIRINSQSGKGGIAYIMERDWGFQLPREMQGFFAALVQKETEKSGRDLTSDEIKQCFDAAFITKPNHYCLKDCVIHSHDDQSDRTVIKAVIQSGEEVIEIDCEGNGPVDAIVHGMKNHLGVSFDISAYSEHSLSHGSDAKAVAYVGVNAEDGRKFFGVGIDVDISIASIKAVLNALS